MEAFSFLTLLVGLLPECVVVGFSVYYFLKKQSLDGLLLSVGSTIGVLLNLFFRIAPMIRIDWYNDMAGKGLFLVTGVIGFVSSVCFALGLGLLIRQQIQNR